MRVYGKRRSDPPVKIEGTKSFSLGLSQQGHPSVIKPNELAESQNSMYTLNGVIEKRPGSVQVGDLRGTSTTVNGITGVYNINGSDYFLRICDDGILQRWSWTQEVWIDITGSPTFSDTNSTILQAWGAVYILNETDAMTKWDGTTFTTFASVIDPTAAPTAVKKGGVSVVTVAAGGTGYSVGNVLKITGGGNNCTCTVLAVNTGAVTSVAITTAGTDYAIGNTQATTVTPAGGSACTLNITGLTGAGSNQYYYRYVWQTAAGNTLSSPNVFVSGLPEKMDAQSYATITMPAAPANTIKTMVFRGKTSGDETYLASVDASQVVYNDKDFDTPDPLYGIPASNTTGGMHFKFAVVFNDTLIGITTEMGDHCLVFSAGGDKFDSFGRADGAGYFYWKKDDGSKITALAEFQEELYVFKTNKIGAFKFTTTGAQMRTISLAYGAVSFGSVHAAGNDLRYWGLDGAMSVGNEPNFTVVRTKILSARADRIVQAINPAELEKITSVYYKAHSIWGLPQGITGTGNNTSLVYNERFAAWSEWFGLSPKNFAKVTDDDNKERLFFTNSATGEVCEGWSGRNDAGTAIVWRVSTKQFDAGVIYRYKTYNRVYFVFGNVTGGSTRVVLTENGFQPQAALALYASNTGSQGFGVDAWGTMEWGDTSGEFDLNTSGINIRYAPVGYKDLFSLQASFSNDGLDDTVQLMGMFIEYSDSSLPLPSEYELTPAYD